MSLPAGTRLGRYEVRSQLGAGGMGEVYVAEDTLLRRSAAVKVLTGDFTHNEERLHRFEREAFAASSLSHPNIVKSQFTEQSQFTLIKLNSLEQSQFT